MAFKGVSSCTETELVIVFIKNFIFGTYYYSRNIIKVYACESSTQLTILDDKYLSGTVQHLLDHFFKHAIGTRLKRENREIELRFTYHHEDVVSQISVHCIDINLIPSVCQRYRRGFRAAKWGCNSCIPG